MIQKNDLQPIAAQAVGAELAGEQPGQEQDNAMGTWRRVHLCLRGNYGKAILLGSVLMVVGAVAAYLLWEPEYQSSGYIRVKASLTRILRKTENTSVMPMFDSYVREQEALLRSRRVTELAMEAPVWKQLRSQVIDSNAIIQFQENLIISRSTPSIIGVAFTDSDPAVAQAGAKVVMDAFIDIFNETSVTRSDIQYKTLGQRRRTLLGELEEKNKRLLSMGSEYGTTDLKAIYEHKLKEVQKTEAKLNELKSDMAQLQRQAALPDEDRPPFEALTADEMVRLELDGELAGLLANRPALELAYSLSQNNKTEAGKRYSPEVRKAKQALSQLNSMILKRQQWINEQRKARYDKGELDINRANAKRDLENIKLSYTLLAQGYQAERKLVSNIGRKQLQVQTLRDEIEHVNTLLMETDVRLDELRLDAVTKGRVDIHIPALQPLRPSNSKSQIRNIVLGAVAGFGMGMGVFVLIGLVDPRFRSIEETKNHIRHLRMLGVLPQLPDSLDSPEQATIAAHAVQQIRMLLQVSAQDKQPNLFSVTSANSGDGKTSLVTALGLSFAASGIKTLLIDFDMAGRGLTVRAEMLVQRRIGDVLLKEGSITQKQLDQCLKLAQETGQMLGKTLVDQQILTEADIAHVLSLQAQTSVGLPQALEGEDIQQCVSPTHSPNLSILPVGKATFESVALLEPATVSHLLERAKQRYGMVLIDTGSIPANIEASMIASSVDGVIIAVNQGTIRRDVERALDHLKQVNAHVVGMVYNRADMDEARLHITTNPDRMAHGLRASRTAAKLSSQDHYTGTRRVGPLALATEIYLPENQSEHSQAAKRQRASTGAVLEDDIDFVPLAPIDAQRATTDNFEAEDVKDALTWTDVDNKSDTDCDQKDT